MKLFSPRFFSNFDEIGALSMTGFHQEKSNFIIENNDFIRKHANKTFSGDTVVSTLKYSCKLYFK